LNEESGKFDAKLKKLIQVADVVGHIEFDGPEAWVNRNSKTRYARNGRRIKQEVKIKKCRFLKENLLVAHQSL
jgi:hypothetical protein